MTVQDRVDLVAATAGLVHALTEDGDNLFGADPQAAELGDLCGIQAGDRIVIQRCSFQRGLEPLRVCQIAVIQCASPVDLNQQAIEQRHVRSRLQRQMHVGPVTTCRSARVDHHDLGAALFPFRQYTLIQYRMAPCEVRPHQYDQIGEFEVLIGARNGIGAKRTLVPSNRGRHAKPRIGVDIGSADKPLHQLVGDVVILGQQLSRPVKGNGIGPVLGDNSAQPLCHRVQRRIPTDLLPADLRGQQPLPQPHRFAQRRAFGTQPPAVGGAIRVAAHVQPARTVRRQQNTAPDTAIGAGRADGLTPGLVHHATLR